jgi:hypothetical protein
MVGSFHNHNGDYMSQIFMSVPRALHFAYLIQAYPAAPESIMARIMRMHVEDCDIWEPRKAKTVDFSGLNSLEIRAECANIRGHIERILPDLERNVILARYGLTDYVDEGSVRRFFFQKERSDAMQALGDWAGTYYPELMPTTDDAPRPLDFIVARYFASKKTTPITLRQLADAFGRNHTFYGRIARKLEEKLMLIENRALDQITPVFVTECRGHSIA